MSNNVYKHIFSKKKNYRDSIELIYQLTQRTINGHVCAMKLLFFYDLSFET